MLTARRVCERETTAATAAARPVENLQSGTACRINTAGGGAALHLGPHVRRAESVHTAATDAAREKRRDREI